MKRKIPLNSTEWKMTVFKPKLFFCCCLFKVNIILSLIQTIFTHSNVTHEKFIHSLFFFMLTKFGLNLYGIYLFFYIWFLGPVLISDLCYIVGRVNYNLILFFDFLSAGDDCNSLLFDSMLFMYYLYGDSLECH